jgi:hypothetical protein
LSVASGTCCRRLGPVAVLAVAIALAVSAVPAWAASSDKAIEKQAVLKQRDFPAGWASSPRTDAPPSTDPACADIEAVNRALRPIATRSPDFSKSQFTMANNSVVLLKTTKQARKYLEPYRTATAVACLESVVKEAFADPAIASTRVEVSPTDDVPRGAHEAAGFDMQVTVTTVATPQQPARAVVLYWDLVVLRVGRALANFGFLNPIRPLPEQDELIDAVVARLEAAL